MYVWNKSNYIFTSFNISESLLLLITVLAFDKRAVPYNSNRPSNPQRTPRFPA
ncbi:unnamed protein product [Periconia digitata]|uniref:Uncharacterized protein n=1 Tax=Periconia digitata TaxID=1303443 RepID=A0A9W4U499_9PLEO|nr:unnamed protein product [Periconia digitata]